MTKEVLSRGFDHLASIANALKKIQEENKDDAESMQKALPLSMVFRALNDVLHPLYDSAQDIFPEQDLTAFIQGLKEAHQEAIEKKIFPPCNCSSCKVIDAQEENPITG
jgi:hypothetical protein